MLRFDFTWKAPRGGLAEPHIPCTSLHHAGQRLVFSTCLADCYLLKQAGASRAKESHRADTQHPLKDGKAVLPRGTRLGGSAQPLLPVSVQ